jgi:hypothetical protein
MRDFWRYVQKTSDCWLWVGARTKGRSAYYGTYNSQRAHRLVYEATIGPIPRGLVLDHLCRNPLCVRPDHLEPVTNKENILRGVSFSAKNAQKTHCPEGHEYSAWNTYTRPSGHRVCMQCRIVKNKASRARRRAVLHAQREGG